MSIMIVCFIKEIKISKKKKDMVWLSMRQPSKTYKLQTSTGCPKAFHDEQISKP